MTTIALPKNSGFQIGAISLGPPQAGSGETHRLTVRDRMVPLDEVLLLEDDTDLTEAAAELLASSLGRALVTHEQRVIGLISLSDVERLLDRRETGTTFGPRPHASPTRI